MSHRAGAQGKRLALLFGALAPRGRERMLLAVAETAARRGWTVDVVVAGSNAELRALVDSSSRLVELGGWGRRIPGLARCSKCQITLALPALVAYLRRTQPDVLLSVSTPPNLAALAARRLSRAPTRVAVRHDNAVRIAGSPRYRQVRWRPRDLLLPRLYPRADAVIAVADGVAESLREALGLSADRVHTVYNRNVTPELTALSREPVAHPWLERKSEPVVVSVGRLIPKKGFETLIRAIARACREQPVRLIVLGEGEKYGGKLRALAERLGIGHRVDLPGFAANPFALMARADCFALASRYEGMPNALVEALACGCPAVATDCPSGPAEILAHGRYGRLVPVGDADALAGAILETVRDPPARERLRRRGRAFSVTAAAEEYLRVLTPLGKS